MATGEMLYSSDSCSDMIWEAIKRWRGVILLQLLEKEGPVEDMEVENQIQPMIKDTC
jgi:hypothetical protein